MSVRPMSVRRSTGRSSDKLQLGDCCRSQALSVNCTLEMHLAISLYPSLPLSLPIPILTFTPGRHVSSAPSCHPFGSMPIRSLPEAPWGSTNQVNPEAEFGSTAAVYIADFLFRLIFGKPFSNMWCHFPAK